MQNSSSTQAYMFVFLLFIIDKHKQAELGQTQRTILNRGIVSNFFMHYIQHCFICLPSDSTMSEGAGIESITVATLALAARSDPTTRLDLSTLGQISSTLGLISSPLGQISCTLGQISFTIVSFSFKHFIAKVLRNISFQHCAETLTNSRQRQAWSFPNLKMYKIEV